MPFTDILYEKDDGIAWITINRPEVYNAIRGRTTDEMSEALLDAGIDSDIRVVVISGSGPNAFCSGRDQGEDRTSPEYSGTSESDFMGAGQAPAKAGNRDGRRLRHRFRQHPGLHLRFHRRIDAQHIRPDRAARREPGGGRGSRISGPTLSARSGRERSGC